METSDSWRFTHSHVWQNARRKNVRSLMYLLIMCDCHVKTMKFMAERENGTNWVMHEISCFDRIQDEKSFDCPSDDRLR